MVTIIKLAEKILKECDEDTVSWAAIRSYALEIKRLAESRKYGNKNK